MKNFLFSLFLCIAFSPDLYSQSVERYVISPCGGSFFNGSNLIVDYTTGEIAIKTLTSSSNVLTQGFQQPFANSVVSVADYADDPLQVILFPNPVYDQLNIIISNGKNQEYKVKVYDILGQLLMDKSASADFDGKVRVSFDLSALATGNYFIRVMHDMKALITQKIIKIDQ